MVIKFFVVLDSSLLYFYEFKLHSYFSHYFQVADQNIFQYDLSEIGLKDITSMDKK